LWPRHIRLHTGLLAGLDVLNFEIAAVSNDRDLLHAKYFLCRFCRLGQQTYIEHLIRHLLFDDQFVLGVNRDLNIVTRCNMRVRRHRPTIGVGERDLIAASAVKYRQHLLTSLAALADRGDLLGQVLDPRAARCLLGSIARIETLEIVVKLSQPDELGQRRAREVAVLVVNGFDPRPIHRRQFPTEQIQLAT
jgi:hypothetical protein